jgi:hypothetical protein
MLLLAPKTAWKCTANQDHVEGSHLRASKRRTIAQAQLWVQKELRTGTGC